MKTLSVLLIAASVLALSTPASARPHHRHQVCSMRHHHRVCMWR